MDGAILITGSGRRLGAAMARAIVAAGGRVVLHARAPGDEVNQLALELAMPVIFGDLAAPGMPERLISDAIVQAGPLAGLINNASRFVFDSPSSVTAETLDAHMLPNLVAPVLLIKYFAAALTLERGVVINILDQKLSNLNSDFFSYTLSKAALATASEMFAIALAPKIRVCAIAPGLTMISPLQTPERFEVAWRANPLQHGATPEDIARAALMILQTPSMTGTTITVDGGEHLMRRSRDVGFLGQS
ncbi:MAG: SDR family oxidoreductase [Acidocella sp.]|nr:SDR family oxidoreductase [Acidocella sp.]